MVSFSYNKQYGDKMTEDINDIKDIIEQEKTNTGINGFGWIIIFVSCWIFSLLLSTSFWLAKIIIEKLFMRQ